MKKYTFLSLLVISLNVLIGCEKSIDTEHPTITNDYQGAFPLNCDTLYFGESFTFRTLFSDNKELGSYSINIHNNFDHHTHSTEVTVCHMDAVKEPVNPLLFIQEYELPNNQTTHETERSIFIPNGNENGPYDEGDYHFFISLTDHEGWSAQMGLSIKILHR